MSIPRVPKHPDESFPISLDFVDRLLPGETIQSATVTRVSGDVSVGTPEVASPLVSFTIGGGTNKTISPFKVKATLNTGGPLVGLIDVPVDDRHF